MLKKLKEQKEYLSLMIVKTACSRMLVQKYCLFKSQQRFKSDAHCVYTKDVNKIALSSNNDKRLHTFDIIRTYPYRTNVFKVCKSEMLSKCK